MAQREKERDRKGKSRKGKHRLKSLLSVLVLLLGAGIFLYPRVSSYIGHLRQAKVIEEYHEISAGIDEERYAEMLAEAQAYNQILAQQPDFDHSVGVARAQHTEEYRTLLDAGENGVMGSLTIPKISVALPIYHGTQERELSRGVGHYEGTSLPVGGEGTHAVLSGHRGLPSADLLTRLDELEVGDLFAINTLGKDITYQVDQIKTVLPDQTDDLAILPGEDHVTLVTCTPYGINSHRLLVRGARTENVPDDTAQSAPEAGEREPVVMAEENRELKELLKYSAVAVGILLLAVLLAWKTGNKKKRKKKRKSGKGK